MAGTGNPRDTERYAKPNLTKVICDRCRWPIHHCVCGARMKDHSIVVRVFEERDVREAFDKLDAGEPLAAFDQLRELLDGPNEARRRPHRRL